jgi:hypothetical protein
MSLAETLRLVGPSLIGFRNPFPTRQSSESGFAQELLRLPQAIAVRILCVLIRGRFLVQGHVNDLSH